MSKRRTSREERRRLERHGLVLEVTPEGKRYWRQPATGRRLSPEEAAGMLRQHEQGELEKEGWIRTEVEGEAYWRSPDSGHLYPRGAAYDALRYAREEP